jgi:hypothetical protein
MSRYGATLITQSAWPAGVNATVTANGYAGALVGGAAASVKLRRIQVSGMTSTGVPIASQQFSLALYRQTVRAAGTGLSNLAGQNLDPNGPADVSGGLDITTGPTFGTNGPTLGANPIFRPTFNTQANGDLFWEGYEEFFTGLGVANGIALVNIGNAFQASTQAVIGLEWEI